MLQRAAADGRCVLAFGRTDFKRLHRHNPGLAGIVSCTRDNDCDALAARIDQAVAATGDPAGQHVRVNRPP